MNYKEFVKLCFYNIRNSIEVSNAEKILPIKTKEVEILYLDENRLSINSEAYKDIVYSTNGYFRCDEIIKLIAKVYGIEYVDNTIRNLLILQKQLFKVIGINEGV